MMNKIFVKVGSLFAVALFVFFVFSPSSVHAWGTGVQGSSTNSTKQTNTKQTNKQPVAAQQSVTQPTDQPTRGDSGGFVPCGNTAGNPCQIGHLFSAFVVIINYLIAMAGFVAVLAIAYAGFMMVYSQGQEQLKAAKGRFSGAIIGLVLVAAAFVLVNALFTGSLSIGVKDGANILANPLDYIKSQPSNSNSNTNGK